MCLLYCSLVEGCLAVTSKLLLKLHCSAISEPSLSKISCNQPTCHPPGLSADFDDAQSQLQVEQALRYAKAIRGRPDDPSLVMRHDEGLGSWTPLLLVQSVYALWDDILLSPAPPPEARGPCPAQGRQYALAVYHYTRCLALAARCSANSTSSACSQAKEELRSLQVGSVLLSKGLK